MMSLMQQMLGDDWQRLPAVLQAHHRSGRTVERGTMDIIYPRFMQPLLTLLRLLGALINRRADAVQTLVERHTEGNRQYWRRTVTYADGKTIRFNSCWVLAGKGQVIEYVNPVLGLQMAPYVEGGRLFIPGVRYVVKLGRLLIPVPEWLVLGHTTIVEEAIDDTHYKMDFRLTHPWFGEIFRYAGTFEADTATDRTIGV